MRLSGERQKSMSNQQNVSMDPRKFATGAVNVLHAAFIGASRAQAKRHFARVQGGSVLDLGKLRLEDRSELMFRVVLDQSHYQGRLSFSAFRQALSSLLGRLVERIRFGKDMNLYTSEETGAILFNVPAILSADGKTNVFMLGLDKPEPGAVTLRLQFLDPEQFRQRERA